MSFLLSYQRVGSSFSVRFLDLVMISSDKILSAHHGDHLSWIPIRIQLHIDLIRVGEKV